MHFKGKRDKKTGKKLINGVRLYEDEDKKRREEERKLCTKREDGVTVCPPRYLNGYGFKEGIL